MLVAEVERGELLQFRVKDRRARIGIDDPAQVRAGLGLEVSMVPEVAQLSLVLAGDEKGWPSEPIAPSLTAQSPHLRQAKSTALVNDLALAQLHFTHAMRLTWVAAVAHVLDEKRPRAGDGQ